MKACAKSRHFRIQTVRWKKRSRQSGAGCFEAGKRGLALGGRLRRCCGGVGKIFFSGTRLAITVIFDWPKDRCEEYTQAAERMRRQQNRTSDGITSKRFALFTSSRRIVLTR